jgi:hypothetical protein
MITKAVSALALCGLLSSAASAQQHSPAKCSQSMIVGTWQSVIAPGPFACAFNIAANGAVTPVNCTLLPNYSFISAPSGSLTIDQTCRVSGSMSYSWCSPIPSGPLNCYTYQLLITAWRSADGSRITGYQRSTDSNGIPGLSTFELVAGQ